MLKSDTIALRAVPEEKAALSTLAAQERMSMSEFLRALIRKEARTRGLWPPRTPRPPQSPPGATAAA